MDNMPRESQQHNLHHSPPDLIENADLPSRPRTTAESVIEGSGASPGIASAPLQILAPPTTTAPVTENISPAQAELEWQRLKQVLDTALENNIDEQLADTPSPLARPGNSMIGLLADTDTHTELRHLIEHNHYSAAAAIRIVLDNLVDDFPKGLPSFFGERTSEIQQLRDQIINVLQSEEPFWRLDSITQPAIVAANSLIPAEIARANPRLIKGLILEQAGKTSHAVIVAREKQIPLITGIPIHDMQTAAGERIVMNANTGQVFMNPAPARVTAACRTMELGGMGNQVKILPISDHAPVTLDGVVISLRGSINCAEVGEIYRRGAKEVALFRTEFLETYSEEQQFQIYSKVLASCSPGIVVIRTFDLGGDKPSSVLPSRGEPNPNLGLRGIEFSLKHADQLMRPQLRAILRASIRGNARILLPMINDLEMFKRARTIIQEEYGTLTKDGFPINPAFKVGAMLETPAAVLQAARILKAADFCNVGTNDLTQYTLAFDRDNPLVQHHFNMHHPSIVRSLEKIANAAAIAQRECHICGSMASDPFYLPLLIGLGFRSFAVEASVIEKLNYVIAQITVDTCQELAHKITTSDTIEGPTDVHHLLEEFHSQLPDPYKLLALPRPKLNDAPPQPEE